MKKMLATSILLTLFVAGITGCCHKGSYHHSSTCCSDKAAGCKCEHGAATKDAKPTACTDCKK